MQLGNGVSFIYDRYECYYEFNRVHRVNLPAVIYYKGDNIVRQEWWSDNRRISDDGPGEQPLRHNRGDRIQWELADGTIHRVGHPAVEGRHGTWKGCKYWRQHGQLHRTDGPAVEYPDGRHDQYWVMGKRIAKAKFEKEYGCC